MNALINFLFGKYIRDLVKKAVKEEMAKLPFTDFAKSDFERDEKGVIKIRK